ncbi:probable aspartic protease At2g35615 [Tripterygium wilfordii]|uniref:probable aspartic protease At2g35615 n=1 Tax=Tripterygium wilfordii TaxID=458696 RepID=UPI0018F80EDF|nr:probable aspartic protease At2g35615 [Tripterygium wilfordii]
MHHLVSISILILLSALILYPIKAEKNSFDFNLVHRDSKFSPFYNQSMTESERSRESFIRSLNRLKSSMYIDEKYIGSSDLTNDHGDYFMIIYIGKGKPKVGKDPKKWDPKEGAPIKLLGYPSMSDDLTWVRCGPCTNCRDEHQSLYDPTESSTYKSLNYLSKKCKFIKHRTSGNSNVCNYQYHSNNDNFVDTGIFYSSGVLSTEMFYLKSANGTEREFSDIVFGCDHTHQGNFKHGIPAVVGLGQGSKLSLVYQLGKEIGEKFSYCLAKKSTSELSKIRIGSDISLYNKTLENRAQITRDDSFPFYYLTLIAIRVNHKEIKIPGEQELMRVDIQSAVTTFPPTIYKQFLDTFKEEAGNIKTYKDPLYGTCFLQSKCSRGIPKLEFHFKPKIGSTAILSLHPKHFLIDFGDAKCLTIVPKEVPRVSKEGFVFVLGSKAQLDVQMIFDPPSHVLKFAPYECASFSV